MKKASDLVNAMYFGKPILDSIREDTQSKVKYEECRKCKGEGIVHEEVEFEINGEINIEEREKSCPKCNGSGYSDNPLTCESCSIYGYSESVCDVCENFSHYKRDPTIK